MSKKSRVGLIVAIVLLFGICALHLSAVGTSDEVSVGREGGTAEEGVAGGGGENFAGGYRFVHGGKDPCADGVGPC